MTTPKPALPRNKIYRGLTVLMDAIPKIGVIKEHVFKTQLGAGATFRRAEGCGYEGFYIEINANSPIWTSEELREFASEMEDMADYLEKRQGGGKHVG